MKRARLFGALAAPAALPPLALHAAAVLCLRMVAKPKRWSETGMREQEIENGFGDCVEAYEKRWARTAFELERDGVTIRGEIIDNLAYLGVIADPEKANIRGKRAELTTADSKVRVFCLPTNEELAIARETVRVAGLA